MKYYLIIFLFLLVIWENSSAQLPPAARNISIAHSNIVLNSDWGFYLNPALRSSSKQMSLGVYYSPSPFGMKELRNYYFYAGNSLQDIGNINIGGSSYGFELYKESGFKLNFSREYHNLSYGLNISFTNYSIENYGSKNCVNFDIGFAYDFEYSAIGISITNLLKNKLNELFYQPLILRAGFGFRVIDSFYISSSIYKEDAYPFSYNFGVEYYLFNAIALRFGTSTLPKKFCYGIGINWRSIKLNYAVDNNLDLGLSHQLDVGFSTGF